MSNPINFNQSFTSVAPDGKRWNGFWAQSLAIGISVLSPFAQGGNELNGPSGGGYRMPTGGPASISRPFI